MPKFRKKPVVIEAMKYPGTGTSDEILAFEKWLLANGGDGPHFKFDDGRTVRRIGKKNTGRTIDGVTHDAFPAVVTA